MTKIVEGKKKRYKNTSIYVHAYMTGIINQKRMDYSINGGENRLHFGKNRF